MMLDLIENKDISELSNFKTQARAKYFFEIKCEEHVKKIKEIYDFAQNNNLKVLVVGGGTNMLFAFDEFHGIVIKNSLCGWSYDAKSQILHTYSSEKIRDIAEKLEYTYNQALWHRFIGLPGSVGGAVYGNAGCFGLETENNFLSALVLDLDNGDIRELSKTNMQFKYRESVLKTSKKYFLISATFSLSEKVEKYSSSVDNIQFREEIQPKGNSCGSFFKNPSKEMSAGRLIEEVGLKGYVFGGASFSNQHANFLMSDGETCTYKDLLYLINEATVRVKKQFNVTLANEVQIITNTL